MAHGSISTGSCAHESRQALLPCTRREVQGPCMNVGAHLGTGTTISALPALGLSCRGESRMPFEMAAMVCTDAGQIHKLDLRPRASCRRDAAMELHQQQPSKSVIVQMLCSLQSQHHHKSLNNRSDGEPRASIFILPRHAALWLRMHKCTILKSNAQHDFNNLRHTKPWIPPTCGHGIPEDQMVSQ